MLKFLASLSSCKTILRIAEQVSTRSHGSKGRSLICSRQISIINFGTSPRVLLRHLDPILVP